MPRYYFDTFDGDLRTEDAEGIDCATMKIVEDCAIDGLPDMARELLPDGPNRVFQVAVRDEHGQVIFRATLELRSTWLSHHGERSSGTPGEG